MSSGYTFLLGVWGRDAATIRTLREQVLVTELGCSPEGPDTPEDSEAFHVLACDAGGRAVGAARMQRDGKIDYVVVLRPWRGRTVGGALVSYLHHIAFVRHIGRLWAIVPESARRFFEKNRGFRRASRRLPTAPKGGSTSVWCSDREVGRRWSTDRPGFSGALKSCGLLLY